MGSRRVRSRLRRVYGASEPKKKVPFVLTIMLGRGYLGKDLQQPLTTNSGPCAAVGLHARERQQKRTVVEHRIPMKPLYAPASHAERHVASDGRLTIMCREAAAHFGRTKQRSRMRSQYALRFGSERAYIATGVSIDQ
jgi:hypothetical protein